MNNIESKVQIHFEGDIAHNHEIPVRTLGKCFLHIQNAFDRAYLDLKYDKGVFKYARMSTEDYIENELFVDVPEEGGYIANLFSRNKKAKPTADRVSHAIAQVQSATESERIPIEQQVFQRKLQVANLSLKPVTFSEFSREDDPNVIREYGDRSIAKEVDEILSIVRAQYAGDSSVEFQITGSSTKIFDFNREKSKRFHNVVARRSVGKAVIYKGTMQSLDKKNMTGKFVNSENIRTSLLRVTNDDDFLKVHPYLGDIGEIEFIGTPLIEFGSMEPNSGDIYFICLLSEHENHPGNIEIK
jgi:hypothetical protein